MYIFSVCNYIYICQFGIDWHWLMQKKCWPFCIGQFSIDWDWPVQLCYWGLRKKILIQITITSFSTYRGIKRWIKKKDRRFHPLWLGDELEYVLFESWVLHQDWSKWVIFPPRSPLLWSMANDINLTSKIQINTLFCCSQTSPQLHLVTVVPASEQLHPLSTSSLILISCLTRTLFTCAPRQSKLPA